MDIMNLRMLTRFSDVKGLLDTVEKRRSMKRELLKTRSFNLVLVCLDRDQEIPPRPEPYDVFFYVIEGSGTFTVGNEKSDLSTGKIVFAPANVVRGVKCKEPMAILGIQEPH